MERDINVVVRQYFKAGQTVGWIYDNTNLSLSSIYKIRNGGEYTGNYDWNERRVYKQGNYKQSKRARRKQRARAKELEDEVFTCPSDIKVDEKTNEDKSKEFTVQYFGEGSLTNKQAFLSHINYDNNTQEETSYRMNVREVVLGSANDKHIVKKYEHFLSTKPKVISNYELLDRFIKASKSNQSFNKASKKGDLLFQVDIYDMHFEKWSCLGEEDVEEFVNRAVSNLLYTIEPYKNRISHIVFPIGNDFFNVDNVNNTTTRGTPQVNRMSFADAIEKGTGFIISLIKRLKQIAPVTVPVIPGNHDASLAISLGVAVKYAFINDKNINVLVDQSKWKFFKWGTTMLAWDHGDRIKPNVFKDLIKEEPRRYGFTLDDVKYYYGYLGHLHHNVYKQLEGFRQYGPVHIEHLGSPSVTDSRHYDNAFMSGRCIHGHLYSKELGRIAKFDSR